MPSLLLMTASSPEIRRVRRARMLAFQQISMPYLAARMSPEELLAGYRYANGRFYSLSSITKRLSRSPVQLCWTLPLNLAYGFQWQKSVLHNP
jgi:hypothetical protein